jgi:hypothetical protein
MMEQLATKVLVGALGGLLTAVLVDLDAWKSSAKGAKFDLETASRRWVDGAVAGGATALGIGR